MLIRIVIDVLHEVVLMRSFRDVLLRFESLI